MYSSGGAPEQPPPRPILVSNMKTRNMYRVAARFSAVALLVLPAACYRYPPPVAVSFPDDPRVLHGEWLMDVRLLEPDVRSFNYVPAHGLLLAWSDEAVYGWQRQPDSSWLEATETGHTQKSAHPPVERYNQVELNPTADFEVRPGDKLVLIGSRESLTRLRSWLD